MYAQFTHAMAYRFDIAEMPELQAPQPTGYLLPSPLVTQAAHPRREDVCLPNYVHDFM